MVDDVDAEGGQRHLGMFPLSTVLFPHADLPLHVFETRYQKLIASCLGNGGDGKFAVVLIDRGREVGGGDHRVSVGTVAEIRAASLLPDKRVLLVASGTERFRINRWLDERDFPNAMVEPLPSCEAGSPGRSGGYGEIGGGVVDDVVALIEQATRSLRRVLALLSELGESHDMAFELALDDRAGLGERDDEPVGDIDVDKLSWQLCARAPVSLFDQQALLELDDPLLRLQLLIELAEDRAEDARLLLSGGAAPDT